MKIRLKKIEVNAMKPGAARISVSSGLPPRHPDKKSAATILHEINI